MWGSRSSASTKEIRTKSLVLNSSSIISRLWPGPAVSAQPTWSGRVTQSRLSGLFESDAPSIVPPASPARSTPLGVVVALDEGTRRPGASIEPLVRLTRDHMERVNAQILLRVGSDVSLIPEVARHLIDSGRKRLRPMLPIAAAGMCGYDGDSHVKLAASVEFMHTAPLLHDDVVDESELRRGKSAARMVWGNQATVLVGDFLLGQAFKMMVEVGSLEVLEILSTAAAIIAEGEVMQLGVAKNTTTTEDE